MKSDIEITDSSRYPPTDSLTPGWSRAIWPDDTPRMATWLWPGPRFCTLKPATFAATPSRSVTPRRCSTSSVGAATEKGTSCSVDSRFSEVTVTSSESWAASAEVDAERRSRLELEVFLRSAGRTP